MSMEVSSMAPWSNWRSPINVIEFFPMPVRGLLLGFGESPRARIEAIGQEFLLTRLVFKRITGTSAKGFAESHQSDRPLS